MPVFRILRVRGTTQMTGISTIFGYAQGFQVDVSRRTTVYETLDRLKAKEVVYMSYGETFIALGARCFRVLLRQSRSRWTLRWLSLWRPNPLHRIQNPLRESCLPNPATVAGFHFLWMMHDRRPLEFLSLTHDGPSYSIRMISRSLSVTTRKQTEPMRVFGLLASGGRLQWV